MEQILFAGIQGEKSTRILEKTTPEMPESPEKTIYAGACGKASPRFVSGKNPSLRNDENLISNDNTLYDQRIVGMLQIGKSAALSFAIALASPAAGQEMTNQQKNAVRSAESYLSFQGFSRKGLIDQLSSPYGDGYEKEDARVAVDSLTVDWNKQAARSARGYLEMMGFSCNGLIDQLSSGYGEQFTKSQATYGAQQAGAC